MSFSADFSELAFQERPSVYSADAGWKGDSDRFEAHRDEKGQAGRATRQRSGRVRQAVAKMVCHENPERFYAERLMGSVRCEILVFEIAYESRRVVSVAEDSIE